MDEVESKFIDYQKKNTLFWTTFLAKCTNVCGMLTLGIPAQPTLTVPSPAIKEGYLYYDGVTSDK